MTATCEVDLEGQHYVLAFDENQLRARSTGDLITCEITNVISQTAIKEN